MESLIVGLLVSVGFFIGTLVVKRVRARLRAYDRQIRLCDLALIRGKPNYQFSLYNVPSRGSEDAEKYWWLRYDSRHGLYEVHREVHEWCAASLDPGFEIENDEFDCCLIIAFANRDDQFHFRMRWL